jgi:hypothetical protein
MRDWLVSRWLEDSALVAVIALSDVTLLLYYTSTTGLLFLVEGNPQF